MGSAAGRYDVWTRFARVHLSTPAERAVYLTLVGGAQESWSAGEIARSRHLDEGEAQGVLIRFIQAGIAEPVAHGAGSPRYRWRADMDYLFGGPLEGIDSIDPVCGMPLVTDSPLAATWEGRAFRFCSSLCRAAFLAFPSSFATRSRDVDAASTGSRSVDPGAAGSSGPLASGRVALRSFDPGRYPAGVGKIHRGKGGSK